MQFMNPNPVSSVDGFPGDAASVARLLAPRWRGRPRFVILQTGFGAGRHFLAVWQAWRDDPERAHQLHYLALESNPCSVAALAQDAAELRAVWPTLVRGFHRLSLDQGRVLLTLGIGEIKDGLPQVDALVDAFYLGEFAAGDSSGMLGKLARLAAPGAMLVAAEASAGLRQALGHVGFVCEPQTGNSPLIAGFVSKWRQPARADTLPERKAIVIGAGLAGAAACERLAARGWRLTLIERHPQPAQQASGNLAGIFMPLISKDDNPASRLTRAAYLFALRHWRALGGLGVGFAGEACGVLQLARDAGHARVQREIAAGGKLPAEFAQWLDADAASAQLGVPVMHGGWLFSQGGWANPAGVCCAMLAACGDRLTRCFNQSAVRLERAGERWQVLDANGGVIAEAPTVILANGIDAVNLEQASGLPLAVIRGQVTHVAAECLPVLPHVVCGDGYLTRASQAYCSVGASYDAIDDTALRRDSHDANLARLAALSPGLARDDAPLAGRVGFRCVATDRLPLVGGLPDSAAASVRCEQVRDVPRLPGLYGLLGYASRGLIWAPLAAELLAAQIEGEPLPIERDLAAALDPARFLFKLRQRRG